MISLRAGLDSSNVTQGISPSVVRSPQEATGTSRYTRGLPGARATFLRITAHISQAARGREHYKSMVALTISSSCDLVQHTLNTGRSASRSGAAAQSLLAPIMISTERLDCRGILPRILHTRSCRSRDIKVRAQHRSPWGRRTRRKHRVPVQKYEEPHILYIWLLCMFNNNEQ